MASPHYGPACGTRRMSPSLLSSSSVLSGLKHFFEEKALSTCRAADHSGDRGAVWAPPPSPGPSSLDCRSAVASTCKPRSTPTRQHFAVTTPSAVRGPCHDRVQHPRRRLFQRSSVPELRTDHPSLAPDDRLTLEQAAPRPALRTAENMTQRRHRPSSSKSTTHASAWRPVNQTMDRGITGWIAKAWTNVAGQANKEGDRDDCVRPTGPGLRGSGRYLGR